MSIVIVADHVVDAQTIVLALCQAPTDVPEFSADGRATHEWEEKTGILHCGSCVAYTLELFGDYAECERCFDQRGCERCDGRGWAHFGESDPQHIEACDECQKYQTDYAAAEQHVLVCSCGGKAHNSQRGPRVQDDVQEGD